VLRFRVLFAGEFKEGRSGNEAAVAVGKLSALRPKVEDRRAPGRAGGKAKVIRTSSTLSPAAASRGGRGGGWWLDNLCDWSVWYFQRMQGTLPPEFLDRACW
jgi:hypothetical protein